MKTRYLLLPLTLTFSGCAHLEHPSRAVASLSQSEVQYVPKSSQKVCQLIGQTDKESGAFTENKTESEAGIVGTDLGFSFEHQGKLVFLFGDSNPVNGLKRAKDEDSIATANTYLSASNCVHLDFIKDPKDGGYNPPRIPGIANGSFNVPSAGVSANGKMYVYFTTGHTRTKIMGRSVLGESNDGGMNFRQVYDNSSLHFINTAPVKTSDARIFIFGTGEYRHSNPYLSVVSEKNIEDKGALKYFSGFDESHNPKWGPSEEDSESLFEQPCLGEFSVARDEVLGKWLMLYNCGAKGIEMRTADEAWGPWTKSQIIFEPKRDGAIGKYVDKSVPRAGGVYGPYMIPSLFETHGSIRTIYYTVSTWDPYAVVLMKTELKLTDSPSE